MLLTLEAIFKLGLPVALLSWFILKDLYQRGELDRQHDRKSLAASLKRIRKDRKQDKSAQSNFVEKKWMRFGGGFYGIAALWTFVVIELLEIGSLVTNFPGFSTLFEHGLIDFVVSVLVNQVTNFITALVWFSYWGDDSQYLVIWVIVAYAGYLLGMTIAKRDIAIPTPSETDES